MTDWDWTSAEREFRQALALNPRDALAQVWYAEYLAAVLRTDEARERAALAMQLDPSSLYIASRAGWVYFYSDADDKALACWRKVLEAEPGLVHARLGVVHLWIAQGKHSEVVRDLETELAKGNSDAVFVGALADVYGRLGRRDEAFNLLQGLERRREHENIPELALVYAYVGLGEFDQAFSRLEIDYREHRWMYHLNVNRLLTPLRGDPRFGDLVRRVGLPQRIEPVLTDRPR
jgi:tetratricopeptide (TPR) repeat protein